MTGSYFFDDLSRFGDTTAIVDRINKQEITYLQLSEAIASRCKELQSPSRLLVFIEANNSSQYIIDYVSCLQSGFVVFPIVQLSGSFADQLQANYCPNLIIYRDGTVESSNENSLDLHPDLAVLLSTSGSTGSPKCVKLSTGNLQSNAQSIVDYMDLTRRDRAFCYLQPSYSFGMSIIHSHLAVGGSLVFTSHSINEDGFWTDFNDSGATNLSGVPYAFEHIYKNEIDVLQNKTLRMLCQAGGKLSPELVAHFAGVLDAAGKELFVMYGQTEAAPRMAWLPPKYAATHSDCIGKAVPGGEFELVDEQGKSLSETSVEGELIYSGPNVMMGYAESSSDLSDDTGTGRLPTGDLAILVEKDLYKITGRVSRIVKPLGLRINLDEIQANLNSHGNSYAVLENAGKIQVVHESSVTKNQARESVRQAAMSMSIPPRLMAVTCLDEIPLSDNGKIDFAEIRTQLQQSESSSTVLSRLFDRNRIAAILGLNTNEYDSITHLFKDILQIDSINDRDTFSTLSGDSLSYVIISLELEDLISSEIPQDWHHMPVSELEKLAIVGAE